MSTQYKILVVDDDERLRSLISSYLTQEGFDVNSASNSKEAYPIIYEQKPHLIILDINMPGVDGLTICRKLRQTGVDTPIIMLTARGNDSDRIYGLEIGADDYLTKPFNPRELVARIRAVLRRQTTAGFSLFETDSTVYKFGKFVFDLKNQSLTNHGENIHMSSAEFALLRLLILEAGKPLSREQLVARMTSKEHCPDQRAIDMLVSRLRKRLENSDVAGGLIRTLRGVGYIFVADVISEKGA